MSSEPYPVEWRPVASLRRAALNVRKHSHQQVNLLTAVIKRLGWGAPVVVTDTGEIVAGHARVMAAHKLGLHEVPCVIIPADIAKDYRLVDNVLASYSSWLKQESARINELIDRINEYEIPWPESHMAHLRAAAREALERYDVRCIFCGGEAYEIDPPA